MAPWPGSGRASVLRDNEAANQLTLSRADKAARRDVRHPIEERTLEGIDRKGSGARLEGAREGAFSDGEAARNVAAASDDMIERERVLGRRRDWRGDGSKTAAQDRAGALNHDNVVTGVDNEHDLTFTRRPIRDSEVTARDFRVGAKGRKAPGLEWLSGQSKRDAIFIGCADDTLPCGKHERKGAVGKRTLSEAERLTRDIEHMNLHVGIFSM